MANVFSLPLNANFITDTNSFWFLTSFLYLVIGSSRACKLLVLSSGCVAPTTTTVLFSHYCEDLLSVTTFITVILCDSQVLHSLVSKAKGSQ